MSRRCVLISMLAAAVGACSRSPRSGVGASPDASSAAAVSSRFEVGWDPRTGKGVVRQRFDDGAVASVCLHCGFPGYTGGLVIGSYSGSGFEYRPPKPQRGFDALNVFCAQDESIWDRASSEEYTYGWSENFGTGRDGRRLEYVSGQVDERGPERVVLRSRNRGGCYQVDKALLWPREARYLVIRSELRNVCEEPVTFDFWTGDDPWLGRYRSSEGDVGYTDRALVRVESRIEPRAFRYGGVYDLGNTAAGEQEGAYSGAANFIMPRPGGRPPDRIYIANRFAHTDAEFTPGRPLDNKSMLAFNLGWLAVELGSAESLSLVYALGLARSEGAPQPPEVPAIPEEHFRAFDPAPSPHAAMRFDFEHIELRLTAVELFVHGRYVLANDGDQPARIGIYYPFPVDELHPSPHRVSLDGHPLERWEPAGATFGIQLPARGTTTFEAEYQQKHGGNKATYIVTSARRWGRPIRRAEFVVRYPKALREVQVSYPADERRELASEVEHRFVRDDFMPTKDVVITWQ